jgi:hypothetical protein
MRTVTASARRLLAAVLVALGIGAAALVAGAAPASAATGMDKLVLTWVEDGTQLQVRGEAFRPKAVVQVRLGSRPLQEARADENGRVRLTVPDELVAAGQSGASIIVSGRSVSGASRVLISAVPPRAAVRGPADVLPWSFAALLVAGLAAGALRRRRPARARAWARDAVAPAGYLCRHAA